MARRSFAGAAVETTTTGSVAGSGAVTVALTASTGWPDGSSGKFAIVVDPGTASEEKMLVTSRSGLNLTVGSGDRGYDGTSATAHSSGAAVYLTVTAVDLDEANAHINGTSASHAATAISNTPAGNIAATTVQAALNELDSEKASTSHTQASTTITDFTEAVQDVVGALIGAGTGLTVTYNDAGNTETIGITAGGVSATELASNAVATAKIADDAVTNAKIGSAAVGATELASDAVTTAKIADGAVTSAKVALSDGQWSRASTQSVTSGATDAITWTAEDHDDLSLATPNFSTFTLDAGWWSVHVTLVLGSAPTGSTCQLYNTATTGAEYLPVAQVSGTHYFSFVVHRTSSASYSIRFGNGSAGTINITTATLGIVKLSG